MTAHSARQRLMAKVRDAMPRGRFPVATSEHPGVLARPAASETEAERLDGFAREVEKLAAVVHRADNGSHATTLLLGILESARATHVLSWEERWLPATGIGAALREKGIELVTPQLSREPAARAAALERLAEIPVGLTGAFGALADSGAVLVTSGPGRGRLASLLPPIHIALVPTRVVFPSLAAFLAAHPAVTNQASNVVAIAGPSRTADIELTLTRGVHGPRELHIVLVP